MAVTFLLDEHLHGFLLPMLQRHTTRGGVAVDAIEVGTPPGLPFSTPDAHVIAWAEQVGRVVVSRDKRTMIGHFRAHLQAGNHSPGLIVVRPKTHPSVIVDWLAFFAEFGDPADFADRIEYIP